MAGARAPSSASLFWRAFANQYNLILLAGACAFAYALESWLPLALAALGEFVWLVMGAPSRMFRRWVARQDAVQDQARRSAAAAQASRGLGEPYAQRVAALEYAGQDTRRLSRELGLDPGTLAAGEVKIDTLVRSFVNMATLHQRLVRFLAESQSRQPQGEILRLTQELEREQNAAVRLSLRQALAVGQRRAKQLEQIEAAARALEVKMSTLEMSFDYLRSQMVGGASAEELTAALGELVTGAGFMGELEAETGVSLARVLGGGTGTFQAITQ
jgi:hypothetical protein